MSTKSTIAYADNYHLYKEIFDSSTVYLQINNCEEFSVITNYFQGEEEQQVTLGIPISIWKKVVEGWIDSCRKTDNPENPGETSLDDSFEHASENYFKKK